MGIRGLHTFATKVVPSGCQTVDIAEEAQKYRRLKGRKPLLAIDLLSFHEHVYEGDYEKLLGGCYPQFNERLHNIFRHLISLGFEMVFFVDGASQNSKMKTALSRRDNEYWRGVKILYAIDEGLDLSGDLSRYDVPNLTVFFENLIQIAKEYGELYISVLHECDQEMVRLANERDALAIVSNDTDFLIFDGPWRLWRDLNFTKNSALEYNKAALRRHLCLSSQQMVLFATLAGNDFVSRELLNFFTRSLRCHYTRKFDTIASYVRRIRQLPNTMQSDDITNLARRIFDRNDLIQGIEALRCSINFYCLIGMQDDFDDFLYRVSQKCSRFIYPILQKDSVTVAFVFCDLSKPIFPPYFDFFKPLLSRLLGVLFSHQKEENVSKTFKFKLHHDQPFTSVDIAAIFPPGNIPPLEDILLKPYGENTNLDNIRWELLCFMISPKLKVEQLRSIPGSCLATYVALHFLVTEKLIEIDDADCLLFSCESRKLFPGIQDQFSFDKVKTIDGRDARMAFLFVRMVYMIFACFSVAGLQKFCGLITFDGLYFHNLRKVWKELNRSQLKLVQKELQAYRIYAQVPEQS